MADVLYVSKALEPPWNDSGKNLVRDLARGLTRHRATVMVAERAAPELEALRRAPVYQGSVAFAPALRDQARVLAYLLRARGHALWHFFFAPNPKSCLAGRLASGVRQKRCVHTISSAPRDAQAIAPLLFADMNVVLSRHTEQRLREAGVDSSRLARIAPAIEPLALKTPAQQERLRRELALPKDEPLLVYPGDLEFGEGAQIAVEVARALSRELFVVLACRAKTERARGAERALKERVHALGLGARVRFVGETARIHDYLACADIVALPSRDLFAKMDYPLVLLEAMSLERCVIVAQGSAAAELADDGGALALPADAAAVIAGVERLLANSDARATLGRAARRSVYEHYLYGSMAAAYERVYDALI